MTKPKGFLEMTTFERNLPISSSDANVVKVEGNSHYIYRIEPPLILDSLDYVVSVVKVITWFTVPNVSPTVGNSFIFNYNTMGDVEITVPTGIYGIEDINAYLEEYFIENEATYGYGSDYPIQIVVNYNTNLVKVLVGTSSVAKISDGMCELFGFSTASSVGGYVTVVNNQISDTTADITRGVITWNIISDITDGGFSNGKASGVIFSFAPRGQVGSRQIEEPNNLISMQVNKREINRISIRLADQNGNTLDLNNEHLDVILKISQVR